MKLFKYIFFFFALTCYWQLVSADDEHINPYGPQALQKLIDAWGGSISPQDEKLLKNYQYKIDFLKAVILKEKWGPSLTIQDLCLLKDKVVNLEDAAELKEAWGDSLTISDLLTFNRLGLINHWHAKLKKFSGDQLTVPLLLNLKQAGVELMGAANLKEAFKDQITFAEILDLHQAKINLNVVATLRKLFGEKLTLADIIDLKKANIDLTYDVVSMKKAFGDELTLLAIKTLHSEGVSFKGAAKLKEAFQNQLNLEKLMDVKRAGIDFDQAGNLKSIWGEKLTIEELIEWEHPDLAAIQKKMDKALKDEKDFRKYFDSNFNLAFNKIFKCDEKQLALDHSPGDLSLKRKSCLERVANVLDRLNVSTDSDAEKVTCLVVSGLEKDRSDALKSIDAAFALVNKNIVQYNGHYCKVFDSFAELDDFTSTILKDGHKRKMIIFGIAHGEEDGKFICSSETADSAASVLNILERIQSSGHRLGVVMANCFSAFLMKEKLKKDRDIFNAIIKQNNTDEKNKFLNKIKHFCLLTFGGIMNSGENQPTEGRTFGFFFNSKTEGKNLWEIFKESQTDPENFNSPLISAIPWRSFVDASNLLIEEQVCNNKSCQKVIPLEKNICGALPTMSSSINELLSNLKKISLAYEDIPDELDKARFEGCNLFVP
ncbi:MAG: hypothetical protein HQK52_23120 [Oligoflexia bacterium]|nr:hypothetical protein [Oligoflexia bacterium]